MHSDCDLYSWGLDCKGFWELFPDSQVQGSLGSCGNRRGQVRRERQLLECAGLVHPTLPQSGLGPLGKASTQSFSSCPQLCHQAPPFLLAPRRCSIPPGFLLGYHQLAQLGKALGGDLPGTPRNFSES